MKDTKKYAAWNEQSETQSGYQLTEHLFRHLLSSKETEALQGEGERKSTSSGISKAMDSGVDNDTTAGSCIGSSTVCSSTRPNDIPGVMYKIRSSSPSKVDSSNSSLSSTCNIDSGNTAIVEEEKAPTNLPGHDHRVNNVAVNHDNIAASKCPFLHMEQLETGEKTPVQLSEAVDTRKPRHTVGCTPHECHGAMMDKTGFEIVSNSYSQSIDTQIHEATEFLHQFAVETSHFDTEEDFRDRIEEAENDIRQYGTYHHTAEELEFGCRVAWRNSGRCIMRKVSFSLELRDCRSILIAQACFEQVVEHLQYATNGGASSLLSRYSLKSHVVHLPL